VKGNAYRVKMSIFSEKDGSIKSKNEMLFAQTFYSIEEAVERINSDIYEKIHNSLYFRSQKIGFDLVFYTDVARNNTYIAYRVLIQKNEKIPSTHQQRE